MLIISHYTKYGVYDANFAIMKQRTLMRFLHISILLMLLGCSNSDITAKPPDHWEPSREELRKAMRYHGITFAEQDDTREWFFLRSGRRCRLFAYLDNRNS